MNVKKHTSQDAGVISQGNIIIIILQLVQQPKQTKKKLIYSPVYSCELVVLANQDGDLLLVLLIYCTDPLVSLLDQREMTTMSISPHAAQHTAP